MGAGDYPYYLQRLIRTTTKNTSNGQEEESFEGGSWLWCRFESLNGRRQPEAGGDQTGGDFTIHVNNYPTLNATDRLTDGETVYHIETVVQGDGELIVDGFYLDSGVLDV